MTDTQQVQTTLANGAIYDHSKGRIVANPGGGSHAITSDNARDMVRLREAKRMRLYAEGAQLAVENRHLVEQYGTDAHLVERAMTLQQIATTPDAGKAAVMADTALQRAQGYDTKQDNAPVAAVTHTLDPRVMALLERIASMPDTVDAIAYDVPAMFMDGQADGGDEADGGGEA